MVLKNEFHDILPGSSIREVYEDAERELGDAIDAGKAAQAEALDRHRGAAAQGRRATAARRQSVAVDAPARI